MSVFGFDLAVLEGALDKTVISREVFTLMFQSGSALVVENREFLNKINLFPSKCDASANIH